MSTDSGQARPSLVEDIKHDGFFHGMAHWAKDKFSNHDALATEAKEADPSTAADGVAVRAVRMAAPSQDVPSSEVQSNVPRAEQLEQPEAAQEAAEAVYAKPSLSEDIKQDGVIHGTMDWVKDHLPGHKHKPPSMYDVQTEENQAESFSSRGIKTDFQAPEKLGAALSEEPPADITYAKPSLKEDIKQDGVISGAMDWVKDHLPGHASQPPAMYQNLPKEENQIPVTRDLPVSNALGEQAAEAHLQSKARESFTAAAESGQLGGGLAEVTYEKPSLREDIKHDGVIGGAMDWVKDHLPGHKDQPPAMYQHPPEEVKEVKPAAPEVTYEKPSLKEDIKHEGVIGGTMDWVKDHLPGHKEQPPAMLQHPAKEEKATDPVYEKPSLKEDIRADGLVGGAMDWVKDHLPGHQHQPPAMYQHEAKDTAKEEKAVDPTYEKPSLKQDIKADGLIGGAMDWMKDRLPGHKDQPPAMFQHKLSSAAGVRGLTPTIGGSVRAGIEYATPVRTYATPSRAYQAHHLPGSVRAFAFGSALPSHQNLLAAGRVVGERRVTKDELMSNGNLVEEQGVPRTYVAHWDSAKRCFEPPAGMASQGPAPPAVFQKPISPARISVTPVGQRLLKPQVAPQDPMMSTTQTILPSSLMQPVTPTRTAMPPPPVSVEPLFPAHPLLRPISVSRPVTPMMGAASAMATASRTPTRGVSPFAGQSLSAAAPSGFTATSVRFPFSAAPRVSVARPPSRPVSRRAD